MYSFVISHDTWAFSFPNKYKTKLEQEIITNTMSSSSFSFAAFSPFCVDFKYDAFKALFIKCNKIIDWAKFKNLDI